jgi:hypothetical protein
VQSSASHSADASYRTRANQAYSRKTGPVPPQQTVHQLPVNREALGKLCCLAERSQGTLQLRDLGDIVGKSAQVRPITGGVNPRPTANSRSKRNSKARLEVRGPVFILVFGLKCAISALQLASSNLQQKLRAVRCIKTALQAVIADAAVLEAAWAALRQIEAEDGRSAEVKAWREQLQQLETLRYAESGAAQSKQPFEIVGAADARTGSRDPPPVPNTNEGASNGVTTHCDPTAPKEKTGHFSNSAKREEAVRFVSPGTGRRREIPPSEPTANEMSPRSNTSTRRRSRMAMNILAFGGSPVSTASDEPHQGMDDTNHNALLLGQQSSGRATAVPVPTLPQNNSPGNMYTAGSTDTRRRSRMAMQVLAFGR